MFPPSSVTSELIKIGLRFPLILRTFTIINPTINKEHEKRKPIKGFNKVFVLIGAERKARKIKEDRPILNPTKLSGPDHSFFSTRIFLRTKKKMSKSGNVEIFTKRLFMLF